MSKFSNNILYTNIHLWFAIFNFAYHIFSSHS
nr:MAG TPA: hypothetical protein [Crassvirales sp.]